MLQFFLKSKHTDDIYPHMALSHMGLFSAKSFRSVLSHPQEPLYNKYEKMKNALPKCLLLNNKRKKQKTSSAISKQQKKKIHKYKFVLILPALNTNPPLCTVTLYCVLSACVFSTHSVSFFVHPAESRAQPSSGNGFESAHAASPLIGGKRQAEQRAFVVEQQLVCDAR